MQFNKSRKPRINVQDIAILGITTALLEVSKKVLEFLPNIELISFFLIIFTLAFGLKMIFSAVAFTVIEIAWYGLNTWVIMYLYIWPLLVILTWLLRRHADKWSMSFLSGGFGIAFGALCSIIYLFIGGPYQMFTWWVAGIPWDILHGVGNFVICFFLFDPMQSAMKRIMKNLNQ